MYLGEEITLFCLHVFIIAVNKQGIYKASWGRTHPILPSLLRLLSASSLSPDQITVDILHIFHSNVTPSWLVSGGRETYSEGTQDEISTPTLLPGITSQLRAGLELE